MAAMIEAADIWKRENDFWLRERMKAIRELDRTSAYIQAEIRRLQALDQDVARWRKQITVQFAVGR